MKKLVILLGCIVILTGCSTVANKLGKIELAPYGGLMLEPLKRSEYEIIGDIEGTGTAAVLFNVIQLEGPQTFGFLGELMKSTGIDRILNIVDIGGKQKSEQIAVYNAIKSADGADAILAPRYETETFAIPGLYYKETVKVYGKAIRIKEDRELKR